MTKKRKGFRFSLKLSETITAKSSTGKKSNNDNWEFLNGGMAIIIR